MEGMGCYDWGLAYSIPQVFLLTRLFQSHLREGEKTLTSLCPDCQANFSITKPSLIWSISQLFCFYKKNEVSPPINFHLSTLLCLSLSGGVCRWAWAGDRLTTRVEPAMAEGKHRLSRGSSGQPDIRTHSTSLLGDRKVKNKGGVGEMRNHPETPLTKPGEIWASECVCVYVWK